MSLEQLLFDQLATPLGTLLAVTDASGMLCSLDWAEYRPRMLRLLGRHHGAEGLGYVLAPRPLPVALAEALQAYFAGQVGALEGIPVRTGGTAFQRAVWAELRTIAPGATRSYRGIAERLGRPRAVRAVGLANAANPVAVVVPCHRVVGADGALTGYAGGIERKRWLLLHEGVAAAALR